MNADERRNGLIEKANSLIDKIQDAMRLVENAERAKDKFTRPDSVLSLELPIEGDDEFKDVFKLEEIFDEKGIEKIKAFILTELELLEENSLKLLEDDSDMIVVPEKLEKKGHSTKALTPDKVEKIKELTQQGVKASEIARQTGVSHQSVSRYSKKYAETIANKDTKPGRSVSRR